MTYRTHSCQACKYFESAGNQQIRNRLINGQNEYARQWLIQPAHQYYILLFKRICYQDKQEYLETSILRLFGPWQNQQFFDMKKRFSNKLNSKPLDNEVQMRSDQVFRRIIVVTMINTFPTYPIKNLLRGSYLKIQNTNEALQMISQTASCINSYMKSIYLEYLIINQCKLLRHKHHLSQFNDQQMQNVAQKTSYLAHFILKKAKITNTHLIFASCFRHQLNKLSQQYPVLNNLHFSQYCIDYQLGLDATDGLDIFMGRRFNCDPTTCNSLYQQSLKRMVNETQFFPNMNIGLYKTINQLEQKLERKITEIVLRYFANQPNIKTILQSSLQCLQKIRIRIIALQGQLNYLQTTFPLRIMEDNQIVQDIHRFKKYFSSELLYKRKTQYNLAAYCIFQYFETNNDITFDQFACWLTEKRPKNIGEDITALLNTNKPYEQLELINWHYNFTQICQKLSILETNAPKAMTILLQNFLHYQRLNRNIEYLTEKNTNSNALAWSVFRKIIRLPQFRDVPLLRDHSNYRGIQNSKRGVKRLMHNKFRINNFLAKDAFSQLNHYIDIERGRRKIDRRVHNLYQSILNLRFKHQHILN